MNKKKEYALILASRGLRVFPLRPNSKIPAIKEWQHRASVEPSQIEAWFEQVPEMNYAVVCGYEVQVLDLDIKNGKDGVSACSQMCSENLAAYREAYLTVSTPSEGLHYYLQSVPGAKTTHRPDGIDYQSYGAYVVGPGCIAEGKEYRLLSKSFSLAPPLSGESLGKLEAVPEQPNTRLTNEEDTPSHGMDSALLREINPDLPYDAWRDAIFAFRNLGGSKEDLQAWSEEGESWDESAFLKVCNSYDPDCPTKLGYRRLKEIATQYPAPLKVRIPQPLEDVSAMRDQVLADLCQILESHGNRPTKEHHEGLKVVVEAMVNGCHSNEKFRIAFPLETGMGKTTAVVALLKSLQHTDRTVLICAERIDQLGDLREELIQGGVNPDQVGIFHTSDKHRGTVPAIAEEALPFVQFLLASHNRIKADTGRATHERLLWVQRKGGVWCQRDLTVWDESLLTTKPIYVERTKMREEISAYQIRLEERKRGLNADTLRQGSELYQFFQSVDELLKGTDEGDAHYDFASKCELSRHPSDYLPQVSGFSCLEILLKHYSTGSVRQLSASSGKVLVQFVEEVDDTFDKIVILDASSRIRDLVKADNTIAIYKLPLSKEYDQVTMLQADTKSSKEALKKEKYRGLLYQEVVCILESLPKDEEVLIFTYKDYKEELAHFIHMQHPFRTVHILHWGQHRASNRYAEIKYQIMVGVQYRDPKEIAASLVSQTRDLGAKIVSGQIQGALDSEQADTLYQAISRGHSRKTFEGRAGEQTIYLLHPDRDWKRVKPILERQMKGVVFNRYAAKHVPPARMDADDPIKVVRDAVVDIAEQLPQDVEGISLQRLRKDSGVQESSNSWVWREGFKQAMDLLPGFELSGRSLKRKH